MHKYHAQNGFLWINRETGAIRMSQTRNSSVLFLLTQKIVNTNENDSHHVDVLKIIGLNASTHLDVNRVLTLICRVEGDYAGISSTPISALTEPVGRWRALMQRELHSGAVHLAHKLLTEEPCLLNLTLGRPRRRRRTNIEVLKFRRSLQSGGRSFATGWKKWIERRLRLCKTSFLDFTNRRRANRDDIINGFGMLAWMKQTHISKWRKKASLRLLSHIDMPSLT